MLMFEYHELSGL